MNGPMTPGGDVASVDGKPRAEIVAGRWVVYMADQDSDGVVELYRFAQRDRSVRKLNGPLVAGGDVREFQVSPDGMRVVYRADQDADEQLELYSVPVSGGIAVRLNGPMVANGDVHADVDYAISSDSQRVVYRSDELTDGEFALFSVPIGGGTPAQLSPASGVPSAGFQITADATRVVFEIGLTEVWTVPIGGGSPVLLTPGASEVDTVIVTPDSARVVYHTRDQLVPSLQPGAVYSVPIDGGTTVQVLDSLLDEEALTLSIAPDSSRLVFVRSNHVYTVAPGGGPLTLIVNPFWQLWGAPRITPDSQHVVFIDGVGLRNRWAFSTSIDVPTRVRLSDMDNVEDIALSPDSGSVACTYEGLDWALTCTSITSEFPAFLGRGGAVVDFDFAWDSRKVVILGSRTGPIQELYSVSLDGEDVQPLSPPSVAGGDVTGFVVGGGPLVLYRADQDTDNVFELYLIHLPLVHYPPVGD